MLDKGITAGGIFYPTGWVDDKASVEAAMGAMAHPVFGDLGSPVAGTGAGKVALLYQAVRRVVGRDLCHLQTIGDCVSHGWGLLTDVTKCIQIDQGRRELFTGETATEVIYAGARVEVGQGAFGWGDGASGATAAAFVTNYGTLVRGVYGDVDLTTYDGNRARYWGAPRRGVPAALEPSVHEHPLQTTSQVRTYEEARDLLANGYGVAVCSNQGFAMARDADGFARPQGTWGHCMFLIAVDDSFRRPGCLCMNSWGPDWISGPKRLDQPDGSFWIDADTVNRMLGYGDSFTGSGYKGYPAQPVDYNFLGN